jgi:hypothetical protein
MLTIGDEVRSFVRAAEQLLSPNKLGRTLNEDERFLVAMCAHSLVERYPAEMAPLGRA